MAYVLTEAWCLFGAILTELSLSRYGRRIAGLKLVNPRKFVCRLDFSLIISQSKPVLGAVFGPTPMGLALNLARLARELLRTCTIVSCK